VNNVTFTMGDLVQRIRVLQGENRYSGGQVDLSRVPFEFLQDLIHAEILRQEGPALGIVITDDDIDEELRRRFAPTAAAGQETDPGQLESEFKDVYLAFLTATGQSDGDFRVRIKEDLSEFALMARFSLDIEDPQQQVEIQWIQLPENTNILPGDVVKRLENEEFTRVAQELNTPTRFAGADGYVGWVPKGAFPGLDEAFFGDEENGIRPQEPGTVSEPIFTTEGFFLVKVLSAAEEQDLTGLMAVKILQESLDTWQQETLRSGTSNGTIKMKFNSVLYAWVADQVAVTAPRIDRPTPVPNLIPGLGG
jgi:parvulin-like peptidyl-prolyl isomerase